MTIDKVICKNLETNPIVNYGIFMNSILPFINNIYLNKTEKVKNLLQNSIKKAFEIPRTEYTHIPNFTDQFDSLCICNVIGDIQVDDIIHNDDTQIDDINIGLMCGDIMYVAAIDIIQKDDKSLKYYFKIDIVVNEKWLSNDDLNNYLNTNKKIDTVVNIKLFPDNKWLSNNYLNTNEKIKTKYLCFNIKNDVYLSGSIISYEYYKNKNDRKNENKYPFVIELTLTDKIDKTSDEWIRFKKIIIEENFKKKVSDCDDEETRDNLINIHNEEMNFLKKMFLDRLLDVFN